MAKEVVITSVPRGIKLGRTGFQVVMRTAGTVDGVLSSLEQLGGYRHVHPQGSGRNPLIYSYRVVRGNTGQLNVLGRTVDAGNDFSNRSNKLAHLLAIDPGELSALRNSSPAAVLAAIDGRLAMAWQGGPEERPSPFALPAPPVQPATCRWWNDVKGDAGWGGLLAQRAMRGQATLVIAPDCSPTWSRRLLDLFQEVLALLPPDGRWKTTFETMVIGSSTSVLRGTYAGSPESATGHAGLLVVDLSQRSPLPANVAPDELIKTAREGPKQAVAGKAPPIPGGRGAVPLPTPGFETSPMPTVGVQPAGPSGPSRAPVAWDSEDERASPSRLGWYIGGGVVLLGLFLASALVGGWYWFDDFTTQKLRQQFSEYAAIPDGNAPNPGERNPPELADWRRAYRDDEASIKISPAEFAILLSALRSKQVDSITIQDPNARRRLVAAVLALSNWKQNEAHLLDHAETLGLVIPKDPSDDKREDKRKAAAIFLSGWLASDSGAPDKATHLHDFKSLQQKIDLANQFINIAFRGEDDATRKADLEKLVPRIWPQQFRKDPPVGWIDEFAKADLSKLDYRTSTQQVLATTKQQEDGSANSTRDNDATNKAGADRLALEKKQEAAFTHLLNELLKYKPQEPAKCAELVLATGLEVGNLKFKVLLPKCGDWLPKAAMDSTSPGETSWILKGLPSDSEKKWGQILLDQAKGTLSFKDLQAVDGCKDHLYVPLIFQEASGLAESPPPVLLARPETVALSCEPPEGNLFTVLNGKTLTMSTTPPCVIEKSLFEKPNHFRMLLNTGTNPGPLQLETRDKSFWPGTTMSMIDVRIATKNSPDDKPRWLGALACRLHISDRQQPQFIASLHDSNAVPWNERGSRFGELTLNPQPPSDKPWKRDVLIPLVKAILDESLPEPESRPFTVDKLKRQFTDKLQVNDDEKRTLREWAADIVNRISLPGHDYRNFVQAEFEQQHKSRPQDPKPFAEQLPEKPSETDRHSFEAKKIAHANAAKAIRNKQNDWDADLLKRLQSRFMLLRFFESRPADKPPEGTLDDRKLATVALGIEAWLALRDKQADVEAAARNMDIAALFSADLDLQWAIGDKRVTVPRLRVMCAEESDF